MKKLLSILLVLAMIISLGVIAFAEGEKDEPDLKTFLSELAEKDKVTEEDLSELLTILGNRIAEEIGTGLSDAGMKHEITSAVFPLYQYSAGLDEDVTLYFLDGANDLPYIEANDWLNLLNDFILGDVSMNVDGAVVTYTRGGEDSGADYYGAPMTLDFDRDTITFVDYNLFCKDSEKAALMDITTLSVFNDAGEPAGLQKVDKGTFTRYGEELVLPLGDYGIELVAKDGLYLIPLQTMSDFIMSPVTSSSLYFNGQSLIIGSDMTACSDFYYSVPTGERSEALAKYGYGELCLMLDNLYGLKTQHNIASFAQLFHDVGLDMPLQGTNAEHADKAIYRLITDFLDDNHSAFNAFSYLAGPVDYKAEGVTHARLMEHRDRQKEARNNYYPDGIPGYEEVGNTAYITFDQFVAGTFDFEDFYSKENPLDFDDTTTIGLIMKAHAMINREDSPIENVVIDLSCNGGGDTDAAVFLLSWFLGEATIGLKDNMTGAMCTATYRCDANRDRQFDDSDTVSDKNLFCLISPFSFSCGNLVPCFFKESGKVTLLGRTSGGGACNVQPISSAWGTCFQISAPRQFSFLKNGSFYDVDRGAEPDFVLATPEKYYDRAALTDYINSLH